MTDDESVEPVPCKADSVLPAEIMTGQLARGGQLPCGFARHGAPDPHALDPGCASTSRFTGSRSPLNPQSKPVAGPSLRTPTQVHQRIVLRALLAIRLPAFQAAQGRGLG